MELELILYLALMLMIAETFGWIFARIEQPVVLGQIIGGILLGMLFPPTAEVRDISMLGVLFLLFMVGLESSVDELKEAGKAGFLTAVVGVVIAFLIGFAVVYPFKGFKQALLYGALTTPTSVSLTVRVLMELDALKTVEGNTIITAAIVDDILGIIILSVVISILVQGGVNSVGIGLILLKVMAFLLASIYIAPPAIDWLLRKVVRLGFADSTITLSMAVLFAFAYLAEHMNLASILGAYLFGLALSETEFRKPIFEHTRIVAHSMFIPLFFVDVGMSIPLKSISNVGIFALVFTVGAIVSKIIGCGLGAFIAGLELRQSLRVGIGMVPRMGVELAMLAIAMNAGIVGEDAYVVIVLMIFLSTLVTPPLLKMSFSRRGENNVG
ncbi:cation:proton antiporter [Thermococcus sp. M39]|uniref:cation:proton antiporter n=1 Tax=unclassified Thermococcus TaxID=2627626 RepID=UPI001438907A|nr:MULTISPECIES: cation:proton antiporter [unclassified Thermococcus]NJE08104.1 cation:proton antiporter [Thermococcus sp. M39]NJE11597.1 cation:proton antiporter [Thermococcus sp. LS2]